MAQSSLYVYKRPNYDDNPAVAKHLSLACLPILNALMTRFDALPEANWTPENLHAAVQEVTKAQNVGFGKVAQPLRVAVTGDTASPSIDQTLWLLGKKAVLERLILAREAAEQLGQMEGRDEPRKLSG